MIWLLGTIVAVGVVFLLVVFWLIYLLNDWDDMKDEDDDEDWF